MQSFVRRLCLAAGPVVALALSPSLPAQAADESSFYDAQLDAAIARYKLPGLAVGVVKDGEVVYRGFRGELETGSGRKVDGDTLFKIASNSKAMTAAVLGRLVDAGKLRWDDPVIQHLPDFAMHDPWVTQQIQVRDLLIHNSGLGPGAGDLMLWPEPNHFTRQDVIRGLRHLQPLYSFRSRYAYDNTLYIVAGEVAAAAAGVPFDQLLQREVFDPLRMTRCQAGAFDLQSVGNVAQPHGHQDGRIVVIRADPLQVPETPMLAAGGIRCSLDDMLRWVQAWLQPQSAMLPDGRPWLSEPQRAAMWTTHTPMPLTARMRRWDGSHFSGYGYGWRLTDVDGTAKVSHTGTLAGMYSAVTLLPEHDAGFVILINADADQARTVLNQVLVKAFTRPDAHLDVAHYASELEREQIDTASPAQARQPAAETPYATVPELQAVLGHYRDPWFGGVSICADADRHVRFQAMKSPKLAGPVRIVHGRPYVDWTDPTVETDAWLDFDATAAPGQAVRLRMAKVDPQDDFSADFEDLRFERIGPCR